jgi:DNA-binding NtrC family response regulator
VADILVVDDDQSVAAAFERFLRHEGHRPHLASDAADAFRQVGENQPDLVFMDIRMPGVDGLQALKALREQYPDVYVVIMTAHGTSQTSIDAIRAGAFEYVTKPLDLEALRTIIGHALSARSRGKELDTAAPAVPSAALVGSSPAMQDVYKMIGRLSTNDVPALVVGERGTGKELVISTIHQNSARRDQPFVSLDCATVTGEVLESEMAAAAGGTLHLASIHALPRALQTTLSRALRGEPRRGSAPAPQMPRVIASTDQDLVAAVEDGAFSRELYETLSVITISLKPLRERREDVPALVIQFIQRFNEQLNRGLRGVDDAALRRLVEHSWPGNAAELESALKRACIVARGEVITNADLAENLSQGRVLSRQGAESALARAARSALQERLVETTSDPSASPYHDIVGIVEAVLVSEALTITNGNQVKASELLGVNRATLRKKADR